ncbi:tRNA lysidine(34) synthetase TilS [Lactiplantibacillus mudanjiangensis]|uniref:tRNA(Ile)-lysidine synthase n=1 Tax=Lactiplantibacillus mudanjiangensis TaxID=1296538 RepID=A0A660E990_9LACO|nr:tRNA lysidine(34) synthetase TilS [Lactiplantibacillus mudanjiangensis]VDG21455.1 tRNA lysidine(34) synthetase TilS [Lactobacillus sp.] [Lactiplantibacillus mudanjiangensis]VDG25788.1 tRNA lysidine(34) synthetase TilS [Lactobacillus sp.] [Lactiplantibacillus mudanjiangensis]VDG29023.1 tRNA lysidine(34) synthetase TilS [Lactobacillus sp.] [Lactiplantibacillus mudanjiangensis]VDG31541.1 tRNA lysidine(34) synthetase TilS [Lactobacillus sp.] [Lactiplantibacillus mudanjiangensis]
MALARLFKRQLAAAKLLSPAKTVIVAVSTGVDSMVLLTLLQQLPIQQRPQLIVAHVNHQLRRQSAQEAAYLRTYCDQHQLPLRLVDWPIDAHPKTGVEAAARQFRYDFFATVLKTTGADAVLTAHHANDQAETYLMKLARGGELAQLTGMATNRAFHGKQLVRPLLPFAKATLRDYAVTNGLTWFEDVTNQDITLTRNRIRQRVVPELTVVNPAFLQHVAAYQAQLQALLTAQAQMMTQLLPTVMTEKNALSVAAFTQVLTTWQVPVLQTWLTQRTGQVWSTDKLTPWHHWILNEQQPTGQLNIDAHWQLVKAAGIIDVCPHKKRVKKLRPVEKNMVDLNQWQKITATQTAGVFEQPPTPTSQPFPIRPTDWPLSWRPWQPQDQLTLKGGGHQLVRRILIDQKVPVTQRPLAMVLVNAQGTVLWLVGYKVSYRDPQTAAQTVFLALKKQTESKGAHLKR